MADDSAATVLSREVKRALSAARLSVPAASVKLGWDRKRLYRWIDGSVSPRIEDVEVFARAVGPVRLQIGGHEEEAPAPPWVQGLTERLERRISDEVQRVLDAGMEAAIQQALDVVAGAPSSPPHDAAARDILDPPRSRPAARSTRRR